MTNTNCFALTGFTFERWSGPLVCDKEPGRSCPCPDILQCVSILCQCLSNCSSRSRARPILPRRRRRLSELSRRKCRVASNRLAAKRQMLTRSSDLPSVNNEFASTSNSARERIYQTTSSCISFVFSLIRHIIGASIVFNRVASKIFL